MTPAARTAWLSQRSSRSRVLDSLIGVTEADPVARKRLVGQDINYGRELLVTLARARGGWIGWEATNLRGIAESLAFVALARAERRIAGDVETGALVNRAIDEAIAGDLVQPRTATLARGLGFRHAVRDALLELRMAGVSASQLADRVPRGVPARELAEILPLYEGLLDATRLVDPAGVFRIAIDAFQAEAPFVLDGSISLAPGLAAHGLPGTMLALLIGHGARPLDGDAPVGLEPPPDAAVRAFGMPVAASGARPLLAWIASSVQPSPDDVMLDRTAQQVDLFAAATPSDELREVLRRALDEGWRWDEVEIVTSDPDAYGIALDVLCQRLDIGATMLHGIPLVRTRLGRALTRWLGWLDDGLSADTIRQALEAGELCTPDEDIAPTALGRELRLQQVGWGRDRWDAALSRLARGVETRQYEDEGDGDHQARKASRDRSARALEGLLTRLLAATPAVPERGTPLPVRASASALARATLAWLALVPLHGAPEERAADRLRARLEQVAAVEDSEVPFSAAMAALRDALSDLRAWPMVADERKPWSATGGKLHLTDIAHAGTTGRPRSFVVGLDAGRMNGGGRQDALLPDAVRRSLSSGSLATSIERRDGSIWKTATALAALRGRVTLSYATSGSLDGGEAGPSPLLLQAWRLSRGDPMATYETMRDGIRPPASAVPAPIRNAEPATAGRSGRPTPCIDARDVWLAAVADGPLLLDGRALVRSCHPLLDAGLTAGDAASGRTAGGHHGIVPAAAGQFDPTARPDRQISPSSLELLARCPMAWFYRHGLGIRAPNDPAYDPESWLDSAGRGALLHQIYEEFAASYLDRQQDIVQPVARDDILAVADAVIAQWRMDVPPPSETVFEAERIDLRSAAVSFLEMEREQLRRGGGSSWWKLEHAFGGHHPVGRFVLPDGRSIAVRGRADRVDRLPDGGLVVIDYKTGKAGHFQRKAKQAAFAGGRQLQPALYSAVIQALLQMPVTRFEYRFPTEGGGAEIVTYSAKELAAVPELVRQLLEHLQLGQFVATDDAADCAFCEYGAICRSTDEGYGKVSTARATWAKSNGERLDVYRILRAIRSAVPGAPETS